MSADIGVYIWYEMISAESEIDIKCRPVSDARAKYNANLMTQIRKFYRIAYDSKSIELYE